MLVIQLVLTYLIIFDPYSQNAYFEQSPVVLLPSLYFHIYLCSLSPWFFICFLIDMLLLHPTALNSLHIYKCFMRLIVAQVLFFYFTLMKTLSNGSAPGLTVN